MASLASPYFSKLFHKNYAFRGGKYCKNAWFFYLQLLSEIFFILRIQPDIVTSVKSSHVKYPLFLSDFNKTYVFMIDLKKKNSSNIKFHENMSSGRIVVPGGHTDVKKLIVALRQFFANAPKDAKN